MIARLPVPPFRIAFTLAAALTLVAPLAAERSWNQWRGPGRDAVAQETGLLDSWETEQPELLWTLEGLGRGYASVSIEGDSLYTTGNLDGAQCVVAVDLQERRIVWSTPISDRSPKHGHEGSRCTPSIDGDRLYAISSNGGIHCLQRATGEVLWSHSFGDRWKGKMHSGWGFSESPLVDGDWVLCTPGGPQAMMVALDKRTGEQVWACEAPRFGGERGANGKGISNGAGYSSIVVSHGAGVKQYVQFVGEGVMGVRAADGKFLWGYSGVANGTANIPTPIVVDDYVFASSGYGTGAALLKLSAAGDEVSAEEQYFLEAKTFENHHGGMVRIGDYIYCGHKHNQGFPICLEWKTGRVVWGGETRGPGGGSACVVYADGHLVFRYQDGKVALIKAGPEGYELKGTFTPAYQEDKSWAHPVILNGRLYLREQNKLMCYNLQKTS